MKKSFKIYQLPIKHDAKFMRLEFVKKHNIMPSLSDYNMVYEGEIDIPENSKYSDLDTIYVKFNTAHPADFKGHSLSMSDVVELDGKFYYCDSFGWEEIQFEVEEEHEVTLMSGHIHFAQNGDLLHGNIKIGTWEKEDVWANNGGKHYDRSGNRLVPFIYWITITTKDFCSTAHANVPIPYYSRNEVREHLNGKKVTVTLKRAA